MGICTSVASDKTNIPIAEVREINYDVVTYRLDEVLRLAMVHKSDKMHGNYWINKKIVNCAESLLSYEDGYERVSQIMYDFKNVELDRSLLLADLLRWYD